MRSKVRVGFFKGEKTSETVDDEKNVDCIVGTSYPSVRSPRVNEAGEVSMSFNSVKPNDDPKFTMACAGSTFGYPLLMILYMISSSLPPVPGVDICFCYFELSNCETGKEGFSFRFEVIECGKISLGDSKLN